jgi:YfiH family protein
VEIEDRQGIAVYRFRNLSAFPEIRHGMTDRHGGSSAPPYDSLNMARSVGDRSDRVAANRQRLWAQFATLEPVLLRQVHSRTVAVLDGRASTIDEGLAGEADAVVTDQRGRLLTILVADCQAVMLYDPGRKVIANIHSGWRGSIADIIGRTVALMTERFACRPAEIVAGIGPSLGPCCAEFVNYREEIPEALWSYRVSPHHFDFWALSRDQLVRAGLRPEHIETGGICTRCRSDLFFSYRAAHRTGRMAAVIGMPTSALNASRS